MLMWYPRACLVVIALHFPLFLCTYASVSVDVAQQPLPIHSGLPYAKARVMLLMAGWTYPSKEGVDECLGGLMDRRCYLFPEIGSCSTTGLGLCRFNWLSPTGKRFAVITQGGNPGGDPGFVSDWFEAD